MWGICLIVEDLLWFSNVATTLQIASIYSKYLYAREVGICNRTCIFPLQTECKFSEYLLRDEFCLFLLWMTTLQSHSICWHRAVRAEGLSHRSCNFLLQSHLCKRSPGDLPLLHWFWWQSTKPPLRHSLSSLTPLGRIFHRKFFRAQVVLPSEAP